MRILKDETMGLVIDVQERLVPHIHANNELIERIRILLQGLNALDIPIVFTEQYPKGLGKTVTGIRELYSHYTSIEKITFSCHDNVMFRSQMESLGRKTVLIAGIEAHVCILQTVLDLLDNGMSPVVVEDAIGSRSENDKGIALKRITNDGGRITTVESVLFELMRTAQHASFKTISNLVK